MIYKASNLNPQGLAFDARKETQFTWDSNGNQTAALVKIWDNSDDNSFEFPITTDNQEYYDIPGNTLTNGHDYRWRVTTWNGTEYANSDYEYFICNATPVIGINSIDPSIQLPISVTATYSQSNDTLIKKFKFKLYDGNNVEVFDTDWIYSFNVEYTFTNLIYSKLYKIQCFCYSQYDQYAESEIKSFTVDPPEFGDSNLLEITNEESEGNAVLNWESLKFKKGDFEGTQTLEDGVAVQDYIETAVNLPVDKSFEMEDVYESNNFTLTFRARLNFDQDGDFCTFGNMAIGYDASEKKFYFSDCGEKSWSGEVYLETLSDFGTDTIGDHLGETLLDFSFGEDFQSLFMFIGITKKYVVLKINNEIVAEINILGEL